jgi:hypothetical protein
MTIVCRSEIVMSYHLFVQSQFNSSVVHPSSSSIVGIFHILCNAVTAVTKGLPRILRKDDDSARRGQKWT